MSDSRQGVLAHHINHALHRGTTMRRYAGDVATRYINTVPLHARQLPLQITRDPIADERHNAQVVARWLDGTVRMPVEAEESLVLSLPEPFRAECQRELAERLGLLAAPLPSKDGARATVTTADLLRETGELMLALSPLFADGKVDAGDLPREFIASDETPGGVLGDEEKPLTEAPPTTTTKAARAEAAALIDRELDAALDLVASVLGR